MSRVARTIPSELASPSLTAAATTVDTTTTTNQVTDTTGWKKQAWDAYDKVGELRYVCQRIANSLSRVTLYAADIDPTTGRPSTSPTDNPTAASIVNDIAGGPAGRAALISKLVTHLTVPGEGWIAVISRSIDGQAVEEWHVLSADEITSRGARITLRLQDGTDHPFDPTTDILTRIHRPHPKNSRESDSPVRAALPTLNEITRTSQAIDGAGKSRLAGNGILLLPSEISMPVTEAPQPDPDAPGLPAGAPVTVEKSVTAQDVMVQLQQVMTTAISDPTSAAAMVPIVLKASGEHLDKIRHIRFESEVTETNLKTRDSAIRRLALSLDIPPELLTGVGGTNHWNAWLVDEDAINTHFAPLATLICDALTEAILRPLLAHAGIDGTLFTVWFDLADLAQTPNRGEDAVNAFDRGAISSTALRQALGFGDDDAPAENMTRAEQQQLAVSLVKGAPSLLPMLARLLGMDVDTTQPLAPIGTSTTPATPTPTKAPPRKD
ncbi:hypothetical protein B842_03365 [Corynebacterium humireducens NBRC 106098 = DSM 45392]|uniref:Portal protein n=1 Tax=Corynebacterium humireducens NBRC 106098 = DSM 45392 TaxID=1223515 RepID=A0A0B5D1L5_9CORY|nr:phage portal protein [Corynebacterium humireducens]AJE32526.1 hypothetical protein B842_03365 [Corynebacterium humireducens NBRC 106098 = DSM 45392]